MNIRIKIDVTKINKSKLFKGEKGTYLNATLIEKQTDFSDFMIVEETSDEERKSGVKGTILGNGSWWKPKSEPVAQTTSQTAQDIDDDLPF